MTNTDFNGKNIVVTGGTTGIGREIAFQMATAGAQVLLVGRDADHLDETLDEAPEQYKDRIEGTLADLSTEEGIKTLFDAVDQQFDKIDYFVNNAALAFNGIQEGSYADWSEVINTNLTGYLACTHHAVERMKSTGSGHIVNIGSMSAHTREADSSVYVAAKSGIRGFSESLRKEVNELGIKVTLIEPGAVDTDMQTAASSKEKEEETRQLKMLKAEDIAAAVIYALGQPERCDVVAIQLRPHFTNHLM